MPAHSVTEKIQQIAQRDPMLPRAEVARRAGCSAAFVTKVLGARDIVTSGRGRWSAPPAPDVRQMVGIPGEVYRAIRDRAEELGKGFDAVAGALLVEAVRRGDLRRVLTEGGEG
jgi:hypothetical protein